MDATSFLVASQAILLGVCSALAALLIARIVRVPSFTGTAAAGGDDRDSRHLRRRRGWDAAQRGRGHLHPASTASGDVSRRPIRTAMDCRHRSRLDRAWDRRVARGRADRPALVADGPRRVHADAARCPAVPVPPPLRRPRAEAVRWAILGPASSAVFFLIIELTGDGQIAADGPASVAWRSWPSSPSSSVLPSDSSVPGSGTWMRRSAGSSPRSQRRSRLRSSFGSRRSSPAPSARPSPAPAGGVPQPSPARRTRSCVHPGACDDPRLPRTRRCRHGRGTAGRAPRRPARTPCGVADRRPGGGRRRRRRHRRAARRRGLLGTRGPRPGDGCRGIRRRAVPHLVPRRCARHARRAPAAGERSRTPYDRALVERLALHSAPALHGAQALADLSATHARLLLAREEERRRCDATFTMTSRRRCPAWD